MADKPMVSSQSRVFLIDGGARADRSPVYKGFARMNGLSQDYGDIEPIYVPSQTQYGGFDDVGEVRGAKGRPTTTLQSRYTLSSLSDMLRLAKQGCSFDVHLHMGACTDPRQFNKFDKVIIFEDATATNYSTDDLGALASDENQVVNESVDLSGREMYEVMPIQYGLKAGSTITTEVLDVEVIDSVSCGSCGDYSDGCYKIFAVMIGIGGSPLLKSRIVYSIDKGATWYSSDIDSADASKDIVAVAKLGDNLVAISATEAALHYAPFDDFDGATTPDWTVVTTGFVGSNFPKAMVSLDGVIYMVGVGGYIYKCEAAEDGVSVVDAGTASGAVVLNAVHGISADELLAVGDNGTVIYTTDGSIWVAAAGAISIATDDLVACWMKSLTEWWVGSSQGNLWYTVNGGKTWSLKAFSGSGAGGIGAIAFSTKNVGWLAYNVTATTRARIFRTIDGGSSWYVTPEGNSTLPNADKINALGVCSQDPNFVVGGGLEDDASDGYIVVGTAV